MQNNDVTLMAFNEIFKEIEKLNRKVRRVRFMNRLYFGLSCITAYALWKEIKAEVKSQIREEKLNEEE